MKNFNIEKTLTVLSNIGVIIGIVFLIIEISQNTQEMRNEVSWARAALVTDLNLAFSSDSELAEMIIRVTSEPSGSMRTPSPIERARVGLYIETYIVHFETRYLTQRTDNDQALIKEAIISMFARGPGMLPLVVNALDGKDYEFQKFVRSTIDELKNDSRTE